MNILDQFTIEPGAFSVMDRRYLDFARLHRINESGAFFVIRAKRNFRFQRIYSQKADKSTDVQCDQTVTPENCYVKRAYPSKIRRIRYYDAEHNKQFVFLTNNCILHPKIIAGLYRCRWHAELFFKWIKQHLRIKAFYGTTENVVKAQVWIAVSAYVLVPIVKKLLKLDQSLYTILQILSVTLLEKTPIVRAMSRMEYDKWAKHMANQLRLFD